MKIVRKLYDWVLHWAHTPYGTPALILLSFSESSFFPVPPDVLQIALSISRRAKSFFYAFISSVSSVLGGVLGYFIGLFLMEAIGWPIIEFYNATETFHKVIKMLHDNCFWFVLTAAFTPIPYKVFTIAAGASQSDMATFLIASAIGRSARFFSVGALIYFFGEKIKSFIERYFNILSIVFMVLIGLGVICVKFLIKK